MVFGIWFMFYVSGLTEDVGLVPNHALHHLWRLIVTPPGIRDLCTLTLLLPGARPVHEEDVLLCDYQGLGFRV